MTNDQSYHDGRAAVINEVGIYIETELKRLSEMRAEIPHDTRDAELTHKRATLAGNVIALCRVRALMNKKVVRMSMHV